jgi:hypothetical protein
MAAFLLFTQSHKFIFSIKLETMIIVKDKGTKRPIYVPRNVNLQPSINNNNSGESGINEDELNKYLEGYITEEELNDALNNIGDTNIVELTQAEYDMLLTNGEIDDNTIYLITDAVINLKTINGNPIIGDGDITIEGGSTNIIEFTQEEYDNLEEKDENTIYVITDAPAIDIPDTSNFATKTDLNRKQNTLVSGQNIKTINGESILGSGNITIEGGSGGGEIPEGVKPTYYLWKETLSYGNSTMLNDNKNVRNILLTYAYSEEFPFVVLKDNYNDTISNNLYIKSNYVEIQCCNSRVGGKNSDLIDERYELTVDGWLKEVKKETVASQNWVYEKIGNIETVLDSIIGDSNGGGNNGSSIFPLNN